MTLTEAQKALLTDLAATSPEAEVGGVIVGTGLRKTEIKMLANTSTSAKRVSHSPALLSQIDRETPIQATWHSHVGQSAKPSQADRVSCSASGLPMVIISHPASQIEIVQPTPFELPLIGREFCHGVVDCYTLIRDYYSQILQIDLPQFYRPDDWWIPEKHGGKVMNLYVENLEANGFRIVSSGHDFSAIQQHDMILMTVRSDVPNHGAVYLGDGKILHHVQDCQSRRANYDQYWQQRTTIIARHESR